MSAESPLEKCAAPDGGRGWVIVFASFVIHMIVRGIVFSFGIFLTGLMEEFNTSYTSTSLISSVQMGVSLCIGPIAANLVKKFGCRIITIVGLVVAATGLITGGLAKNIVVLYITSGFCTGIGVGLVYLASNVIVLTYFQKKRALATGIASCGSGIGAFVMAPIISLSDNNLGWGHSMMLMGSLMLACIPLGILFRPIKNENPGKLNVQQEEKPKKIIGHTIAEFEAINKGATSVGYCPSLRKIMPKCSTALITCLLSSFLFNIGFAAPIVYTVERAMQMGIAHYKASFLISLLGISNIIGKIGVGYISDIQGINRFYLYSFCLGICGLSLAISNFGKDYSTQVVYCTFFGASTAAYSVLTPVILIDLFGLESYILTYGIDLLSMGAGTIIGPPIIGAFHDATGSHHAGFYFAGINIFISGLIFSAFPLLIKQGKNDERLLLNQSLHP